MSHSVNNKSYLVSRDSLARFVDSHKALVQNVLNSIPGQSTTFMTLAREIAANKTKAAVNSMYGNEIEQLVSSLSVAGQGGAKLFEKEVLEQKKLDFSKIKPMTNPQEAHAAIEEMFTLARIAGFSVAGLDRSKYIKGNVINFNEFQKDLHKKDLVPNEPRAVASLQDGPKIFAQALRSNWLEYKNSNQAKMIDQAKSTNSFVWDTDKLMLAGTREQIKNELKNLFEGTIAETNIDQTCNEVLDALEIPSDEVVAIGLYDVIGELKSELGYEDLLAIADSDQSESDFRDHVRFELQESREEYEQNLKQTSKPGKTATISSDKLMKESVKLMKVPKDSDLAKLGATPLEQAIAIRKLAQYTKKGENQYVCKLIPNLPANVLALVVARDCVLDNSKSNAIKNGKNDDRLGNFIKALGTAMKKVRDNPAKKAEFIKAFDECKSAYPQMKTKNDPIASLLNETSNFMNDNTMKLTDLWSEEKYKNFWS